MKKNEIIENKEVMIYPTLALFAFNPSLFITNWGFRWINLLTEVAKTVVEVKLLANLAKVNRTSGFL